MGTYSEYNLPLAFAEAWNGATWTLQSVPTPPGSVSGLLGAVGSRHGGLHGGRLPPGQFGGSGDAGGGRSGCCGHRRRPTGSGYWLANGAGVVSPHGATAFHGDARSLTLAQPVRGISATRDGQGYWLVAADGGVFRLRRRLLRGSSLPQDSASTSTTSWASSRPGSGRGYWLVGADGGVFAFGDAPLLRGSLPSLGIHVSDIVGISPAPPTGDGYLLAGSDGGVFAFGATTFRGSLPGLGVVVADISGIAPSAGGNGYAGGHRRRGVLVRLPGTPLCGWLPGDGVSVADVVGVALDPDRPGLLDGRGHRDRLELRGRRRLLTAPAGSMSADARAAHPPVPG